MIYIFDIDGTLADISHRLHFIQQEPKDWRAFFAACPDDVPIEEAVITANMLHDAGGTIVAITGRSDEVRRETKDWLRKYVSVDGLLMRKAGDHREDSVVKGELLDSLKARYSEARIIAVFEDRKQVVDMYRAKGLRVFQVAEGNF